MSIPVRAGRGAAHLVLALAVLVVGCEVVRDGPEKRWQVSTLPMPPLPAYTANPTIGLTSPSEARTTLPLVEVAGQIGSGLLGPHHIVLTLDTSRSVFSPTGVDIDSDGTVGELCHGDCGREPQGWTTDFDDTVVNAELRAARSLIGLLDANAARMGLVKFGATPSVEEPVGDLDALVIAIDDFDTRNRGSSDPVGGIHRSIDILEDAAGDSIVQRAILLLSDGGINVPRKRLERWMRRELRADPNIRCGPGETGYSCWSAAFTRMFELYSATAIARARLARTRVFTFGVGVPDGFAARWLRRVASETGGVYTEVKASADILLELPLVDLAGLSHVEMENTTTGEPARAIRVFPNGSFDGLLTLAPGPNALHIRAVLASGEVLEEVREIERVAGNADARAKAALLKKLRERTTEMDLARRIQVERRRRGLQKSLEIEVETDAP